MTIVEIINLIAIVAIPIFVVFLGQYLQNRSLKRSEKVKIFKRLMAYRNIGYTDMSTVEYLNQIPILFINSKRVMSAYNEFIELMNANSKSEDMLSKIERAKKKLLESLAMNLHYNKINWKVIESPYLPPETLDQRERGEKFFSEMSQMFSGMNNFLSEDNKKKLVESLELSLENQKEELKKIKAKKPKRKTK